MTRYPFAFNLLCTLFLITAHSSRAAETSKTDGFQPLFNGKDFTGWKIVAGRGAKDATVETNKLFTITDGMVHMYRDVENGTQQPFGYIVTEKEFSHYHLRFQYKWGEKKFIPKMDSPRDAGLLYHVIGGDGVWPKSVECQVQEGDTGDIFTVFTRVTTPVDPATTNTTVQITTNATTRVVRTNLIAQPTFKPLDKGGIPFIQGVSTSIRRVMKNPMVEKEGWNTVEVIVHGENAVHVINGQTNNAIIKLEHMVKDEWVPLNKGKILLQQEGAEVFYRNIEIKLLDQK